jgi:hypothetical protein
LHWNLKQQKYPFLMVLATHSRLKSFWCWFFPFIFIYFTCHTTHCDFYLFFWKIIKDFETLSIDMKKHVNFLLMQMYFYFVIIILLKPCSMILPTHHDFKIMFWVLGIKWSWP